jgi:hypothetical protein
MLPDALALFRERADVRAYIHVSVAGRAAEPVALRREAHELVLAGLRLIWDSVLLWAELLDENVVAYAGRRRLAPGRHLIEPRERLTVGDVTVEIELMVESSEKTMVVLHPPVSASAVTLKLIAPVFEQTSAPLVTQHVARRNDISPDRLPRYRYEAPRHASPADEPTARWDLAMALRPTPDWLGRIGADIGRWRKGKKWFSTWRLRCGLRWRLLVLGLGVVGVVLGWLSNPRSYKPSAPVRVQAQPPAPNPSPPAPAPAVPLDPALRDAELKAGIDAYRRGRISDALGHFEKLAAHDKEPTAPFLVWFLKHDLRGRN